MLLVLGRTFKQSLVNFFRNGWLSVATISILIFSLYIIGTLSVITLNAQETLKGIQKKVNISVYFNSSTSEEEIMKIKEDLENYSEIRSADYVSKEQALENFKRNNADEPVILKSLEEIGENPLLASLVVRTADPNKYEVVANYIENGQYKDLISRINYGKNKEIINKLNGFIAQIKRIGVVVVSIFFAISILITFNTIRITIYTHKQEIEIMRLVGASNTFIRLPFVFEGIIYGLLGSLLSLGTLFATLKLMEKYIPSFVFSQNLASTYLSHIWWLIGTQALLGVLLGVVSSLIAMRKYLKI